VESSSCAVPRSRPYEVGKGCVAGRGILSRNFSVAVADQTHSADDNGTETKKGEGAVETGKAGEAVGVDRPGGDEFLQVLKELLMRSDKRSGATNYKF